MQNVGTSTYLDDDRKSPTAQHSGPNISMP